MLNDTREIEVLCPLAFSVNILVFLKLILLAFSCFLVWESSKKFSAISEENFLLNVKKNESSSYSFVVFTKWKHWNKGLRCSCVINIALWHNSSPSYYSYRTYTVYLVPFNTQNFSTYSTNIMYIHMYNVCPSNMHKTFGSISKDFFTVPGFSVVSK